MTLSPNLKQLLTRAKAEGRTVSETDPDYVRALDADAAAAREASRSTRTTPPPRERPDAQAGRAPAVHTREERPYSLLAYLRASSSGDWRDAKLELRAHDEIRERTGAEPRDPRSRFLPYAALLPMARQRELLEKRDVTTTTAASLVATDLMPEDFVELLRNEAVVVRAGARVIPNLVGNVDIPRQNLAAVGGWIATEGTDAVEGQLTTDKITLTPRTFALYQELTRKLVKQSTPGAEELVREDLRRVIGLGIDSAALIGTGASGQPTGVLVAAGVGTVAHSAALTSTWANILEYETDISAANAPSGRRAWMMRAAIRAHLKGVLKVTADAGAGFLMEPDSTMNGFPAFVSEQLPASGTAGALVLGDWSELVIGMWGVLDLFADPFSKGNSGTLVVRGFQDVDIGIRHAASFSKSTVL